MVDRSFEDLFPIRGKSFVSEDSSFTSGDSPVTLDVNADLGYNGVRGFVACDGSGDILVSTSWNGTDFDTNITLKREEVLIFDNESIDSIKITHSGIDSSYRVRMI